MAILSNGKFYGFLCSAKETGQKLANGAKEYVENFVSGFAGHGWKIWEYVKGKWMLEIDSIRVRGQFTVFELLVSKIRAIIGAQAITQGCGRIKTAKLSDDGTAYLITLEDKAMSFVEHDFIRCQEFDGGQKMYHVEIESVADGVIRVPISEFERDGEGNISNSPAPGDDIVQFGNSSHDEKYAGRHSAIYMHADEGAPAAIDVMDGIYSKDWSNCLRVRMGGNIPDSGNLKGLYCVNGMIKGTDDTNHVTYCLYPDGTAELGDGCALFKPDRSGHIAGGAISWEWNESKKEYVCTMRGTVLTWDNLDDEAKENLKGEPGKDGSDGVTGNNGVSLVYKGEFASHPANPQSGWYYRNTTDKKSYVYQDNAWYVMTVDGSDGKNGLDGANGQDGNDGLSVVWKGDLTIPPMNPQKNWAYRDTDNGRVYIYNGTAWELMVADGHDGTDGTDGADGMKVYITYHDSETEPELPTGDGTIGGWHTNATSSVVWMSQKVAADAVSGEWGGPIRIKGKPGEDANMLPWLDKWNGYATELGEEYIVTPKMFSGTSRTDENEKKWLTGIAQGKECITDKNGMKRTGIFALVDNEVKFALDPNTGEYLFKGRIEANEGKFTGEVNATSGTFKNVDIESGNIGRFKIDNGSIGSKERVPGVPYYGMYLAEWLLRAGENENKYATIGSMQGAAGTSTMLQKAAGRFVCKSNNYTDPTFPQMKATNTAVELEAENSSENIALNIKSGWVKGFRVKTQQLDQGQIEDGVGFAILGWTNFDPTVYLPANPKVGDQIIVGARNKAITVSGNGKKIFRGGSSVDSTGFSGAGRMIMFIYNGEDWSCSPMNT